MTFYSSKSYAIRGNDAYYTPKRAIDALLKVERFRGTVLEPACGDGAISSRFKDCISFDLEHDDESKRQNFLQHLRFWQCDHVVTNPPFKFAQAFAEKALLCASKKVALLLKLSFLEGSRRKRFLETSPLETVYVFSDRLNFLREGDDSKQNGTMAFAWFVWNKKRKLGHPTIKWI
jgi:hypothetical protein